MTTEPQAALDVLQTADPKGSFILTQRVQSHYDNGTRTVKTEWILNHFKDGETTINITAEASTLDSATAQALSLLLTHEPA